MKGYKAFNKDMTCRNFQYKEGETYAHKGKVEACDSGFHFCENPIDTFSYYSPANSIHHEVEGSGTFDKDTNDTKVACSEIKIGAKLSLHDLIGAGIEFMFSRKYNECASSHTKKDRSASSATGYQSASSATGDQSASSATGYQSASSATGDRSASSATGYRSASSATGYQSASSATGDRSASSATGDASIALSTGHNSKTMAGKYGVVALQWWNEDEKRSEMKCAETGCGDGSDGKLKAETWYRLNENGEFVEAE